MSTRDNTRDTWGRVLVIDPDPVTSHWMEQCVRSQGYEVTFAWDAESALLAYEQDTRAVIANMRRENAGVDQALRELRAQGRRPKVIAFGRPASSRLKGTLVMLPEPMDAKNVETALDIVQGMKELPVVEVPRHMSVRPVAA